MAGSSLLQQFIDALCCMPGVGKKSAQRIAWHLLQRDREGALRLAGVMDSAMRNIAHCRQCRAFSEQELCAICANTRRDASVACIVESPADVYAIEETGYRGMYFVLMGHLSPLDGIGPDQLGLDTFGERLRGGELKEIILATNATMEGEATAHFIAEMAHSQGVKVTRIALGVPLGGELEYLGSDTITHALAGRSEI